VARLATQPIYEAYRLGKDTDANAPDLLKVRFFGSNSRNIIGPESICDFFTFYGRFRQLVAIPTPE
jgi:hypothetical protein